LNTYWAINGRFVDAVCEEAKGEFPLVLVQDYHFALAPLMLRGRLPLSVIVAFWHIPWPPWQVFQICPWRHQLIEGLLGSNIVGLQTASDCRNFMDTVDHCLEAHVDREQNTITYLGHRTLVRAYPTSIEWPNRWVARSPSIAACQEQVRRQLDLPPNVRIAVGVDRLDYTKGIEEKLLAVERLIEWYPEFRERLVFVQLGERSRQRLTAYRDLRERVIAIADRINARFGSGHYVPIFLLEGQHSPAEVYRFLRAADVCYVGSLDDGMNLVSKEFISARDDERGVLVLSAFTGAARELSAALLVNPYDLDLAAHMLARALTMEDEEQRDRMHDLRSTVAEFNAYRWAGQILTDAARVRHARHNHWPAMSLSG
jgi:trehalose 6-phosphate synthase